MRYLSDVTDAKWDEIKDFFVPTHTGRPPKHDRRAIYNAIWYVLRTGCQWRLLPKDFPPWFSVYMAFYRQRQSGVWQRINAYLRANVREKAGKSADPSVAIMDSQTVKTVQKGRQRGYNGGKQIKGRKRHVAVDTLGLLLAVVVHSAGISDSRGARCLLLRLFRNWPNLAKIYADGGYKTGLISWAWSMLGYLVQVVKRTAEKGFQVIAKRWIVERSFGWLIFQRRFSKDYEHHPKTSETMLYVAFSTLMLRRLHPL